MKAIIIQLFQWLKWMFKLKTILPFCVGIVGDRELTKEEYEYPTKRFSINEIKQMLTDGRKSSNDR